MFTLSYPLICPDGHAFYFDDRFSVPLIDDSIEFVSISKHQSGFPQVLVLRGFADFEHATNFAEKFGIILKCATLSLSHGLKVCEQPVCATDDAIYDGNWPTIFQTSVNARPVQAGALGMLSSNHVSVLISAIADVVQDRSFHRVLGAAELKVAIELFSEVEFAGGTIARFVILFSVLEVLVERGGRSKRSQTLRLVKDALSGVGRDDGKKVTKKLDSLYQARNDLLHEGKPVSHENLCDLLEIVRDTLRALLSREVPPSKDGSMPNSARTLSPNMA